LAFVEVGVDVGHINGMLVIYIGVILQRCFTSWHRHSM